MGAVNKVLTATPDARASLVKGSPTFWNAASYVYQKWKADQERKKRVKVFQQQLQLQVLRT